MTFYDALWHFMTLYDVLCQVRKATEIVIKCRKVSQDVAKCRKCRKMSQIVVKCRNSRPLPAVPFWISPILPWERKIAEERGGGCISPCPAGGGAKHRFRQPPRLTISSAFRQCAFPCCPVKGAVLAFFFVLQFFCLIAWRRRFFELLSSTSVPHHRPLTSRETPSHSKPTSAATMCVL